MMIFITVLGLAAIAIFGTVFLLACMGARE